MGHYNNATICLNGHVVSKYQANYQKFCSKCGKETYSKCPECNSPIHGKYEVDGIVDLSGSYNRPDYCYNCGAPYPWTKIILDNQLTWYGTHMIAFCSPRDAVLKQRILHAQKEHLKVKTIWLPENQEPLTTKTL